MLQSGYYDLKSSKKKNNINNVDLIQFDSLSHLELVVNSNILLPVKVGQDDLQLVIALAGQTVDPLKAKPALS